MRIGMIALCIIIMECIRIIVCLPASSYSNNSISCACLRQTSFLERKVIEEHSILQRILNAQQLCADNEIEHVHAAYEKGLLDDEPDRYIGFMTRQAIFGNKVAMRYRDEYFRATSGIVAMAKDEADEFKDDAIIMSQKIIKAIARNGIVSAAQRKKEGHSVLGSIDYDENIYGLSKITREGRKGIYVQVVVTERNISTQAIANTAVFNEYDGVVPVISERPYDTIMGLMKLSQTRLGKLLSERTRYGIIFVIDPTKLNRFDTFEFERYFIGGSPTFNGPIRPKAIKLIIVPREIESLVRSAFPKKKILVIEKSVKRKFTLVREQKSNVKDNRKYGYRTVTISIPDYQSAIQHLLDDEKEHQQWNFPEAKIIIHATRLWAPSDIEYLRKVAKKFPYMLDIYQISKREISSSI